MSSLYFYKVDDSDRLSDPVKLNTTKINDSTYLAEKVFSNGKIGFGISGYDRQDLAANRNGIYKYETYYNNKKIIEFKFDSFFLKSLLKFRL